MLNLKHDVSKDKNNGYKYGPSLFNWLLIVFFYFGPWTTAKRTATPTAQSRESERESKWEREREMFIPYLSYVGIVV